MFDSGALDGFKGAVKRWLFPCVVFSSVCCNAVLVGLRKQFIKKVVFPAGPVLLGLIIIIIMIKSILFFY